MTFSRSEKVAGALALVLALLHRALRPDSGTDLAAQLARASFAREAPLTPVDLSWYGGVHPFGYSLLSPWLLAVLGVGTAGVLAAVGAAVLFARLVRDLERPVLAASLGAVFSVADVASGRLTFALSVVPLLGALLVRERRVPAIALAVLTGLLSPVGAAFLGLCAAVLVLHRRPGGWTLGLAASLPVAALGLLFPSGGVQPYSTSSAVRGAVVAVLVLLVTTQPLVRTGALLYAGAVIAFALHDDAFGSNVLRLGLVAASAVVVASSRRSTVLVLLVAVWCVRWQVQPLRGDLTAAPGPALAAVTAALVATGADRVEVVPLRDHREAWFVAESVPLARGWARQVDLRDNPLFYRGDLGAQEYLSWLQEHGVDHVAAPRTAAVDMGGRRERDLLREPVPGLTQVWQDADWTVWAVDDARGLAPGAQVDRSTRTDVVLRTTGPGDVAVALRWSRWLTVSGPACLGRSGDQVLLRVRAAGSVRIGSSLSPDGHC